MASGKTMRDTPIYVKSDLHNQLHIFMKEIKTSGSVRIIIINYYLPTESLINYIPNFKINTF